jgi:hypothetical protein
MAIGEGIANMKQLAIMQQKKDIHISKIPLASKKQKDEVTRSVKSNTAQSPVHDAPWGITSTSM